MKTIKWGFLISLFLLSSTSCQSQATLFSPVFLSTLNHLLQIHYEPPRPQDEQIIDNVLLEPTEELVVIGAFGFSEEVNPLTGLVVEDPQILDRRPVLTKISNFPPVGRPHAGLSYADIVFEYYIGEWTNRFLALFYSHDVNEAWPLRSGRLVDSQLTKMYQGVLSYGNADPRVDEILVRDLGDRAISFNEAPCPAICGKATHSATGVHVNTAELSRYASDIGLDNSRHNLDGMLFSETPPISDQYGVWISVQYIRWNRGEWFYDSNKHLYMRWIESWDYGDEYPMIPLVDKLNGEQIAFSNIIIIFANYIEYAPTLHDIDIWENTKGQRALIFRDGIVIDGYWRSQGDEHPIQFLNQWGLPVALKPGSTWIVIAGNNSTVENPGEGQWQVLFDIP